MSRRLFEVVGRRLRHVADNFDVEVRHRTSGPHLSRFTGVPRQCGELPATTSVDRFDGTVRRVTLRLLHLTSPQSRSDALNGPSSAVKSGP